MELNATANLSGMGTAITMRVDIEKLPRVDQISMLHTLMRATGTTMAIRSQVDADTWKKINDAIDGEWRSFEKAQPQG